MIYSVLFDSKNRENNIKKRNGCHFTWQSLSPEIKEYVKSAGNANVRVERQAAYNLLFSALCHFFKVENPKIHRDTKGKPSLTDQNIYFNISHSDGLVLVTLSDEYDVGCDIQCEPEKENQAALEKRFLKGTLPCSTSLDINYFLATEGRIYEVDFESATEDSFTDKWVKLESIMKLSGEGFSALPNIENIAQNISVDVRRLEIDKKHYSIANSIKNG